MTTTDKENTMTETQIARCPLCGEYDVHGHEKGEWDEHNETKAELEAMIGQTVTWVYPDGKHGITGTLESVYVTDGLAANVIGLVDWSKNGKDYGRDFCLGPLYGATLEPTPAPWIGLEGGYIVKVYVDRYQAERALKNHWVESVAPFVG